MKWLIGIAVGAIGVLVTSWLTGFLSPFVKSPERTRLALANVFADKPAHSEDSFRIVLCWLENDYRGEDTKNVARALTNVEGIELVRTDGIVSASGAKDAWSDAMRNSARSVLQEWNADLAIVGLVKRPGEVLSLWLVPQSGEGTLERGDRPYQLEAVTLGTACSVNPNRRCLNVVDRFRSASTPQAVDSRIAIACPGCERGRTVAQMERAAWCRCDGGKRKCAARHGPAPTSSRMKTVAGRNQLSASATMSKSTSSTKVTEDFFACRGSVLRVEVEGTNRASYVRTGPGGIGPVGG